jgi:hypothetical protein
MDIMAKSLENAFAHARGSMKVNLDLNAKRILVEEEGGEEEKVEASMSPGDLSYAYHEHMAIVSRTY